VAWSNYELEYEEEGAGVSQSAKTLGYGLDDQGSIPGTSNDGNFSLRHRVQTDSGTRSASYPMGTGEGVYPRGKAAGA
jgi:hypothetical protein